MQVAIDKPLDLETLVEVYCDKSRQGFPANKENMIKMAGRMRQIGLLDDRELAALELDAEKIVKAHKA